MRFGLNNALAVFMDLMNWIFWSCLDKYVVVLIDDILVYSNSTLKHEQYLRNVLQTLRDHWLNVKLSKYEFWLKVVIFLGHIILAKGIWVDPRKVEVVPNWERPSNMNEI
jgi:hypothetical protein